MQFSLRHLLAGLTLLAGASLASPVPVVGGPPARALEKRTPGGIYMCTGANWSGYCEYGVYALNQCWQTTGDLEYQVSSFGPDQGTLCVYYYDRDCTDRGDINRQLQSSIVYPGDADLTPYWDNAIGSFKCQAWTPGG